MEAESSGNEEIEWECHRQVLFISRLKIPDSNLFSFSYSTVKLTNKLPHIDNPPQIGTVVTVDFGGDSVHNDLVSCLTDNLNKFYRSSSRHDVIIKPSEVCAFHLRRASIIPGHAKASPDPFVFPKSIFLDRFLFHNLEFTNEKRELEQKMMTEIKELMAYKATLTRFNVSAIRTRPTDCLHDLLGSGYFAGPWGNYSLLWTCGYCWRWSCPTTPPKTYCYASAGHHDDDRGQSWRSAC